MIKVENNCFIICGLDYSYIFGVNECGYLEHIYYGKKIDDTSVNSLNFYLSIYSPKEKDINYNFNTNDTPTEYGCFGKGDYKSPSFIIKRSDGVYVSNLKYKSYRIEKGVKELEIMPSIRKADETLIISLYDEISKADIELYYIVTNGSNSLTRYTKFINNTADSLYINRAYSFAFDLLKNNYKMLKLQGDWANERNIEIDNINHGITKIESLRGGSSHQMNPFVVIMDEDSNDTNGDCYSISLIYSGSYQIEVVKDETNLLRIEGGINDLNFSWELKTKDEFITPEAVITYSNSGLDKLSIDLSRYYRNHLINPNFVYKDRPIVINNWEATYFDFDNNKLKNIIDKAIEIGIDTFVLDDGWFKNRNDDNGGLGDWSIDFKKLPNGLKEISEYCANKGIKFGLWFEPEMVSEKSDLYLEHEDYVTKIPNNKPRLSRNQLVLDFTRDEVIMNIYNKMDKIISELNLKYIKWDCNRPITDLYSHTLDNKNMGEFYHRFALGVYKLYSMITNKYKDLFIEGCAGGGGRFDPGILYYSPQIWTSDDTDAYMRSYIEYSTSIAYPISAMSCHVSACPNHQTFRVTDFETRCDIASIGPTGFELDPNKMDPSDIIKAKEYVCRYKNIHSLILNGDYYRISNPFTTNYFISMIVGENKEKAYLVGFKKMRMPLERPFLYKLKGLDPKSTYKINELNLVISGDFLMNFGLFIPNLSKDFSSWSYTIEKIKGKVNFAG